MHTIHASNHVHHEKRVILVEEVFAWFSILTMHPDQKYVVSLQVFAEFQKGLALT